jgi:Sulfate permease family
VATITLASGVLFLLLAVFRMGWIAQFLSRAVVTRFLFGAAVDVVIGELPKLTGMDVSGRRPIARVRSAPLPRASLSIHTPFAAPERSETGAGCSGGAGDRCLYLMATVLACDSHALSILLLFSVPVIHLLAVSIAREGGGSQTEPEESH